MKKTYLRIVPYKGYYPEQLNLFYGDEKDIIEDKKYWKENWDLVPMYFELKEKK